TTIQTAMHRWCNTLRAALHEWMRSWRQLYATGLSLPRVRRRSIPLGLEILEGRQMLNATLAPPALMGDLAQLGNDVTTSTIALVNRGQPSQPNMPAWANLENQYGKWLNTLTTDVSKAWQTAVSDELAALARSPLGQAIEQAETWIIQTLGTAQGWYDMQLDD